MSSQFKLPRKDVARAFDRVRSMLALRIAPEAIERVLVEEFNIPALVDCTGEAHSNSYIDNCGLCAPRWGIMGAELKIT